MLKKPMPLWYFVNTKKLESSGDIRRSTVASQRGYSERQARAYLRKFRGMDLVEELYWAIPQDEWRHIATFSMPHTLSDLRGRARKIEPSPKNPPPLVKRNPRRRKIDPRQLTLFPK